MESVWYYRRKIPLRLKDHPFWKGSAYWSHSLNLKLDAPQHQLNLAWNEVDQKFAHICANIESRNLSVLNEIELDKRAIARRDISLDSAMFTSIVAVM